MRTQVDLRAENGRLLGNITRLLSHVGNRVKCPLCQRDVWLVSSKDSTIVTVNKDGAMHAARCRSRGRKPTT